MLYSVYKYSVSKCDIKADFPLIYTVNHQGRRKIFNLWVPSVKAEDQKKKKPPAYVTALLESLSLTALLEYLDLFSNI